MGRALVYYYGLPPHYCQTHLAPEGETLIIVVGRSRQEERRKSGATSCSNSLANPVTGDSCIPTAPCPVAMKMLLVPGTRPIIGIPSVVAGRRHAVCFTISGRPCSPPPPPPTSRGDEISRSNSAMCHLPAPVVAVSNSAPASSVVPTQTSPLACGAT